MLQQALADPLHVHLPVPMPMSLPAPMPLPVPVPVPLPPPNHGSHGSFSSFALGPVPLLFFASAHATASARVHASAQGCPKCRTCHSTSIVTLFARSHSCSHACDHIHGHNGSIDIHNNAGCRFLNSCADSSTLSSLLDSNSIPSCSHARVQTLSFNMDSAEHH